MARPILQNEGVVQKGRLSEYNQKKSRHTLFRLISYFKYHPMMTAGAFVLALLSNLVVIVKPYILKVIIDDHLTPSDQMETAAAMQLHFSPILVFGLLYLTVILVGAAADYAQSLLLSALGQRIMHRLRSGLFGHLQKMSMSFFDRNSSGSLLTRVSSDVESLSELYTGMVVTFVKDIILIASVIVMMLLMDFRMALYAFLAIPVVAVITFLYRYFSRRNFIRLKAQLSRINSFLAENILGMRIVQIFSREKVKKEAFDGLTREYYRLGIIEILLNALSNPLLNAVANLTTAFLIAVFAEKVLARQVEVGVLYAFITYIKQLFSPIATIAEQFTAVQSSIVSADRIFDIIDNKGDVEDMEKGLPLEHTDGDIEFRNVWFAYNGENWVLRDISFHIRPGEQVAFVGATGSGKTTIISLLCRFYEIQRGEILLDGVDIRTYRIGDLRRLIAIVMQDVFLFTGDINYNIRLNNKTISDGAVMDAAEAVSADGFINSLPDRYRHQVAERGSAFSSGQRQLVAFARAIAFDPSILILDEATANIDMETEMAVQKALRGISGERTSLIVAHRISTIVHCNQIFVLHKGKLREQGTHAELLERGGIYSKLYQMSVNAVHTADSRAKKSELPNYEAILQMRPDSTDL